MTVLNSDISDDKHEIKRRKLTFETADHYSKRMQLPEKMKKFIRTRKLMNVLTCVIIIVIPMTCIFIGFSISNYFSPPIHSYSDAGVIVDVSRLNYSWYNSHNMTIDFIGGLGNQMFQFASLVGISRANGLKPVVVGGKLNDVTRVFKNLRCTIEKDDSRLNMIKNGVNYSIYSVRKSNAFENRAFSLNFMKNIRLSGYFQSWRYFDHVRSEIKQRFSSFDQKVSNDVRDFLNSVLSSHAMLGDDQTTVKFVGIHVRRGDFMDKINVDRGYSVADSYFYKRAMQFFLGKLKNVIFVVTTDDKVWSEKNIRSNGHGSIVVHSKFIDHAYDLKLLSSCNHTIFSGSSFGWWGAWLSGGLVVYNKDFPQPDSLLSNQFKFSDYYLPQWIPM